MFTSSSDQIHYPSFTTTDTTLPVQKTEVLDIAPAPENLESKKVISEYANEKNQILENSADDLTQNLLDTIDKSNVSEEAKAQLKKIVTDEFITKAKAEVATSTAQISEIANSVVEPIPPAIPPQMESAENLSPFEKGKARYEKMSVSIAEAKNKTSMMSKKIGSKISNFLNKGKNVVKDLASHALASGDYLLSAHSASEKFIVDKYDQAGKYSKETFGKIENKSKNAFWTMKLALQEASYARATRKNEKVSAQAEKINAQVVALSQKRTDIVGKLNNLREKRGAVNI